MNNFLWPSGFSKTFLIYEIYHYHFTNCHETDTYVFVMYNELHRLGYECKIFYSTVLYCTYFETLGSEKENIGFASQRILTLQMSIYETAYTQISSNICDLADN